MLQVIMMKKKCEYCKKSFEPKSNAQRFCNMGCCKKKWYRDHKEFYREYYIKNKDDLSKYRKEYYQKNRKKIIKKANESHVTIPTFGTKGTNKVYTNGLTQDIKDRDIVNKIKNDVLNDCIANPKKYLRNIR